MKRFLLIAAVVGILCTLTSPAFGASFVQSSRATTQQVQSFAIGDLNGDGKPDLASADGANSVIISTNAGNGICISNAIYTLGDTSVGDIPWR
jgi:hypothetical protein